MKIRTPQQLHEAIVTEQATARMWRAIATLPLHPNTLGRAIEEAERREYRARAFERQLKLRSVAFIMFLIVSALGSLMLIFGGLVR
jgi:hypothetical protein